MFEEHDTQTLEDIKKRRSRRKKNFSSEINRQTLSDEEMDELFLSY